jgi:hypothetical protein
VLAYYNDDRFDDGLKAFQKLPAPTSPPTPAPGGMGAPPATVPTPATGGAADPARLHSLLLTGAHLEAVLAAPIGAPPGVAPSAAPQVSWQARAGAAWRTFLGRWLPLIIGAITVIVIALIGLKTQWSSNVTFGAGGVIDDVALFLWGVAAFVTGKTLSDFLSTVVSK